MTDKVIEPESNLIKAVVLSIFDENGPSPKISWPDSLDEKAGLIIAMKTISLLMGDSVYQDSDDPVNYFGILHFPDLKLNGLTYFFLIPDEEARGHALAATITVLIDEDNKVFFYQNMKYLRVIIDRAATKIQAAKELNEQEEIMDDIRKELFEFTKELKDPFSTKRQIKILLTGLDKAGKTSFLNYLKLGKFTTPQRTMGVNYDTVKHKNLFLVWCLLYYGVLCLS